MSQGIKIDPSLIDAAIEDYKMGMQVKDIAIKHKINSSTILSKCKDLGLSRKRYFREEENIIKIKALYESGLTSTKIGEQLGVCRTIIGKILRDNGVITERGVVRNQRVKFNPFANLNDPETQYWLGWIASDGNVANNSSISLCTCLDHDILYKFQSFIGTDIYINIKTIVTPTILGKKSKKDTIKGTAEFINHETAAFLTNIGITPRKSLTLKMNIPLTWNFLRGYYDGNGCLSKRKFTSSAKWYTASSEFSKQLMGFLIAEGFTPKLYEKPNVNECCKEITLSGYDQITKLLDKMYYLNCIHLERKLPYYIKNWHLLK